MQPGAVDVLKQKLATKPVQALPVFNGQYTTDTDQCVAQEGRALL